MGNETSINNDAKRHVTPEMKQFAQEYALWTITYGQAYLNALSPNFTMDDPMEIFLSKYYGKNWISGNLI